MKKRKNIFILVCVIVFFIFLVKIAFVPKIFVKNYKGMVKYFKSGSVNKRKRNSELKEFPVDIFANTKKSQNRTFNDKKHHTVTNQSRDVMKKKLHRPFGHKSITGKDYGAMGSAVK